MLVTNDDDDGKLGKSVSNEYTRIDLLQVDPMI